MPRGHCVSLLAVVGLMLGGCGDSGPAASGTATAVGGKTIAGSGYELTVAAGWYDVRKMISPQSDVTLGTARGSVLNIVRGEAAGAEGEAPPKDGRRGQLERLTRVVLEGGDMTRLRDSTPIQVDGAEGLTTEARIKTDQGITRARVVLVIHDGHNYALVASSSPREPTPTSGAVASMLRSWHWTR